MLRVVRRFKGVDEVPHDTLFFPPPFSVTDPFKDVLVLTEDGVRCSVTYLEKRGGYLNCYKMSYVGQYMDLRKRRR